MNQRLISSAVMITLLCMLLYLDFHYPLKGTGGLWLLPLLLGIALLATSELTDMLAAGGLATRKCHVMLSVALVHLLTFIPTLLDAFGDGYPADCPIGRAGWPGLGAVLGMCWLWIVEMRHYEQPGVVVQRLASSALVILYTGVAMSFLTVLRTLDSQLALENDSWGLAAVLSVVIITKTGDSGAYFIGKTFGRHKMAPRLSPGKTVEGACGALVTGTIAALCVGNWMVPLIVNKGSGGVGPLWCWAIYGLVIACTGMFGDLAESLIKRDMQQKDSSNWLPGLGGMLDIMDSITLSVVPAYLFWISGFIGPS